MGVAIYPIRQEKNPHWLEVKEWLESPIISTLPGCCHRCHRECPDRRARASSGNISPALSDVFEKMFVTYIAPTYFGQLPIIILAGTGNPVQWKVTLAFCLSLFQSFNIEEA